jgi:predicted dehydrogenase
MKLVKIGIIGAGGVARGIHIPGFRRLEGVEVAAVCDPKEEAAAGLGIARVFTRYEDLLASGVDAVVVATPNYLHPEIVMAAAAAGKHVLCEKPLALNLAQAKKMVAAVERAGVVHMTAFTFQFTPAYRYLRHLVTSGAIGRVRSVRAAYIMALSRHLLGWRSRKELAGSGVLADIGSHLVHLARLACGEIQSLTAMKQRFREDATSDVEDWISFLARFESGACGTFEISRIGAGRGAAITEETWIEVYGTAGSVAFSAQNPWGVEAALGEDGRDPDRVMRRHAVPEEFLKVEGSPRVVSEGDPRWSYRYDQAFQFVESVRSGRMQAPTLADGVRCQAVLDAAMASSESLEWVDVAR